MSNLIAQQSYIKLLFHFVVSKSGLELGMVKS